MFGLGKYVGIAAAIVIAALTAWGMREIGFSFQAVVFAVTIMALSILPRSDGFFSCSEPANSPLLFRRDVYFRYPFIPLFIPRDTNEPRFRNPCQARVPSICGGINLAKIAYAIIRSVSVYVVQKTYRKAPIVHEPSNPMPLLGMAEDRALRVPIRLYWKSWLAGMLCIPSPTNCQRAKSRGRPTHAGVSGFPRQLPSFRIVFKKLAQDLCRGQVFISHVVSPHVRGQGRALLTQRFRPAFFSKNPLKQQVLGGG